MRGVMLMKQKVYEYVDLTDDTPIQQLSLLDQLRLAINKLTYDPGQELKRDDAVTKEVMTLKADLLKFLRKSTDPIRNGSRHSVDIVVSSKFKSVLKEVLNSPRYQKFYKIKVSMPEIEYDIPYDISIRLEVKV